MATPADRRGARRGDERRQHVGQAAARSGALGVDRRVRADRQRHREGDRHVAPRGAPRQQEQPADDHRHPDGLAGAEVVAEQHDPTDRRQRRAAATGQRVAHREVAVRVGQGEQPQVRQVDEPAEHRPAVAAGRHARHDARAPPAARRRSPRSRRTAPTARRTGRPRRAWPPGSTRRAARRSRARGTSRAARVRREPDGGMMPWPEPARPSPRRPPVRDRSSPGRAYARPSFGARTTPAGASA